MKNKICVIIFLIMFGILFMFFLNDIYYDLFSVVSLSKKEVSNKINEINGSNIEEIYFNNKKLSNSKQIAILDIMKEKNMIQISTTVRVLSHDKPNNILKFILTDRREIVVDFYFSKKCQNNMVKTKKGMMYVQAEKLCEELADEKIE